IEPVGRFGLGLRRDWIQPLGRFTLGLVRRKRGRLCAGLYSTILTFAPADLLLLPDKSKMLGSQCAPHQRMTLRFAHVTEELVSLSHGSTLTGIMVLTIVLFGYLTVTRRAGLPVPSL